MTEHLTVVLITYKRTDYAVRTIQALGTFLHYPTWGWYISDDGSPSEHLEAVTAATVLTDRPPVGSHSEAISYGAGANRGLTEAFKHGQLVLMLEDDWELTRPLDIWKWAALLMERPDIGMVRTGYLNTGIRGDVISHNGSQYWTLDDTESRHHSSHAFAGHPALIHQRFFDSYGLYPERWQPGETELRMCWQISSQSGPAIVWPAELGAAGPWAHIGGQQSYDWNGGLILEPNTH